VIPFGSVTTISADTQLTGPAPVPDPQGGNSARFSGEPVQWISIAGANQLFAFSRSSVRILSGHSVVFTDIPAFSWTLIELSPLPFFIQRTLLQLDGGLPVMYVLLSPQASTTLNDGKASKVVGLGELVATTAGSTPSAWFSVCMQDRIMRDPALWSGEIGDAIVAAGDDPGTWPAFAAALQNLGRPIYILNHVGRPFADPVDSPLPRFTVTTGAGSFPVTPASGNTGIALPATGTVQISFDSAANPMLAGVETAGGAFEAEYQLPANTRFVLALDANTWMAERDPEAVGLSRWNANSFLDPIPDGNPYFARLVQDMRLAQGSGGGVGLAGWAFVKESLLDKTIQWPLIPGQDDTRFLKLVKDLNDSGAEIRLLVNQFLQVENNTFDDGETVLATLWAFFAATFVFSAFGALATDPAGFGVLFGCMAAANFLIDTNWTIDALRAIAEPSKSTVDDLAVINSNIAKWSPYRATTSDNPLYVPPFQIAGITIDDVIHFGVYHQKFVVGRTTAGKYFGYLGGIDINSDRVDSPIHRAQFPYHDVQARLSGPALKDLIQTFADRSTYDNASVPFPVPTSVDPAGDHLVQVARTYYAPSAGNGYFFAPKGESLIHRSNLKAIRASRDFIYIEEQYFTPDDEYLDALCEAANHARALIITLCMQNGQVYGPIRRTQAIDKLQNAWGVRVKVGALVRRHLNPTPANFVNLGRCVLAEDIDANALSILVSPTSHVPDPPFWVFVGGELMQATAKTATGDPNQVTLAVNRGPVLSRTTWGSKVDSRSKGSPVMCVNVPHIYVHAKLMIVDDIFLSVGSANMNRRGHFHDGEINAIAVPQNLKRDPLNPARVLRCKLWGEHLGLTPEMGLSLFADPLSALPYFDRPWLVGNRWQPLNWAGEPTDTEEPNFTASDSMMSNLLTLAIGSLTQLDKSTFWPVLVDPTSFSDPNPTSAGPEV
jgi:phosphatidylserine/phosphatidylglycerophosphate/cardiolipin synthase-like enzyme